MQFLKNLFISLLTGAALGWIAACMKWLCNDKGVLRMSDGFYLIGALGGIVWVCLLIWVGLSKPHH